MYLSNSVSQLMSNWNLSGVIRQQK
jgi:hypothetical protein